MTSSSNSADSVVFNGNTFVQNLPLILAKNLDTNLASETDINYNYGQYFSTISTATNPFTTLNNFLASSSASVNGGTFSSQQLYSAFLQDFETQIGYPADFSGLNISSSTVEQWFTNSFNNFLSNYTYSSNGTTTTADFFNQWVQYMANTANIQTAATVSAGSPATSISLANYQAVYQGFFPNNTPDQFQTALQQFITAQETANGSNNTANGWFIPSQSFNQWFTQMSTQYKASTTNTNVELKTTVDTTGSASALIVISRVINLLISMVNILQEISASQAQQLSFTTNWESAYTNMLTQVPQYSAGGNPNLPIDASNPAAQAFRDKDINPHMQAILQNVQAQQTNVQDTAKSEQTNINQSQDASNQLTQMVTSMIQQLSTILQSIYPG